MFKVIVMINKDRANAYISGNSQFFDKEKSDLYQTIIGTDNHGGNNNFLNWARGFTSISQLEFFVIESSVKGEAMSKAKHYLYSNNISPSSIRTREYSF
ncbi:hypothetical protein [Aeromonas veronii]|uniref:GIY-YIG nuclease family protein n=1 Tax=Aeromonas veronii TaxID=654 RepID=A0A653L036_AERVE|nr:hypothetical protein [Aeromonas veronii]KAE9633857.1 hypothetical protein GO977_14125 [Aeromonas veronii]MCX9131470.1 hypothetical protein [Aeromonas veronii]VXA84999.1 conserved hypothetical protein [Aeromonas veronii]